MNPVLVGAKAVVADAKHVSINMEALRAFAKSLTEGEFVESEFGTGSFLEAVTVEEQLAFTLVYSALNFCFWGSPKWAVRVGDAFLDGSFGLFCALKRAVKSGLLSLKAESLANLPEQVLREVLAGSVEIPLFAQRLPIIHEIGSVVEQKYVGSFAGILEVGNFDCLQIAKRVALDFPLSFGDTMLYQGRSFPFLKKAQLFSAFLFDLGRAELVSWRFSGYRELTALADYKVPQVLRSSGILVYSEELAGFVDNVVEIPQGCEMEVEIRAATVWSVEQLCRVLIWDFPQICPMALDGAIWHRGQHKNLGDKPYHRTLTTAY